MLHRFYRFTFFRKIILKVQQFYESNDLSTMMPGQKDTKFVKVEFQGYRRVKLLKTSLRFPIINLFWRMGVLFFKSLRPSEALYHKLMIPLFFYFRWSSDELRWSRQNPFFWTPREFAIFPTYFLIFSHKKFIISSWNTYLLCGKTFVIN